MKQNVFSLTMFLFLRLQAVPKSMFLFLRLQAVPKAMILFDGTTVLKAKSMIKAVPWRFRQSLCLKLLKLAHKAFYKYPPVDADPAARKYKTESTRRQADCW